MISISDPQLWQCSRWPFSKAVDEARSACPVAMAVLPEVEVRRVFDPIGLDDHTGLRCRSAPRPALQPAGRGRANRADRRALRAARTTGCPGGAAARGRGADLSFGPW